VNPFEPDRDRLAEQRQPERDEASGEASAEAFAEFLAEPGNSDDWVQLVRDDFPALAMTLHGRPLCYLDNASTTQKPDSVIAALVGAYEKECANIHRGVHALSQLATERFESVREKVRRFIRAPAAREVVFTRGTTESINLLAQTLGRSRLSPGAGDAVLVSGLEHHSNLVPWQRVCAERGAELRVIPLLPDGQIDLEQAIQLITPRTRIVAISHASNALGVVVPVAALAKLAHAYGAIVVVDGAQAAPHLRVDVKALGCDFYCFSGHKLYGPTGVGVLWGRAELLEALPPWQTGGDMALSVSLEGDGRGTTFREIPYKFEAGTPPIAEVIGLGAALDYIQDCGRAAIAAHEAYLYAHGVRVLSALEPECGLRLLGGTTTPRVPVLTFTVDGVHPHDLATALDLEGIAVRAGHHCAQPLMRHLGVAATVRASLACYNTIAELDALADAIVKAVHLFRCR
jgi:cysteine desulfurase/selenocysteine lyase